jgi:hypothetical protein
VSLQHRCCSLRCAHLHCVARLCTSQYTQLHTVTRCRSYTVFVGWARGNTSLLATYSFDMAVVHLAQPHTLGRFFMERSDTYTTRSMRTAGYPADKTPEATLWRQNCDTSDDNPADNVSRGTSRLMPGTVCVACCWHGAASQSCKRLLAACLFDSRSGHASRATLRTGNQAHLCG